ncbi:hypothetical protein N8I71_06030 [Roseibacterium sp. SDUM158016]|jgi:hypothetical protein|uniref:hypothetical protein n=1 Tax=Roseicyclus sediminis TaxID=2980997 RepID=UPI0021D1EEA3|nr:hypothetical protein [Roseibacterium sp. SDUM158016]MCU4652380.1 hypothetical protein [Roseibacterium sp. SDUM158016]
MKRFIITAAIVAATAAPALAADNARFVIDQLNMSADSGSDLISVGPNGPVLGTTVSSRGDSAIAASVRQYNASIDSAGQRINGDTVTVFSGTPAYAADIFEQLRLADDSN